MHWVGFNFNCFQNLYWNIKSTCQIHNHHPKEIHQKLYQKYWILRLHNYAMFTYVSKIHSPSSLFLDVSGVFCCLPASWYFPKNSTQSFLQKIPGKTTYTSSPTCLLTLPPSNGRNVGMVVVGETPRRLRNFTAVFMRFKRMVSGSLKGDHPTTNSQEKLEKSTQLYLDVIVVLNRFQ